MRVERTAARYGLSTLDFSRLFSEIVILIREGQLTILRLTTAQMKCVIGRMLIPVMV